MTTRTAHALNPGEHLGHYEILRELGRGGMATVYLAHDRKHDRPVALKVLHPQLAATLGPERFLREILTTARLTHPHILPLHDSGNANGLLYYVMPFVQGESLRQRLARSGGLPVRDALTILREVTSALAYAHHHGVIHRDIKPENILLSEESALVADFGIAKAVSAAADSSSNGTSGTATGLVLGTPAYMAPEQAAADPHLDHRADLYALGCVLYEMVSGRPPFERPSRQAMMAAHAAETPVPVLSLRPDLPPALADLTMRLLARNPADRPDSAASVLAVLEDVPAQARPATTPSIRRSFPVRWPLWLGAGAVVVFAAGVLVAILAPRKKPARLDSRVVAIAPFRVSSVDSSLAYLREGMVDLLATKLNGTTDLRAADPRTLLGTGARRSGGASVATRDQALALARSAGAGRVIQGEVVGTGGSLTLSASVIDVPSGRVQTQTSVEGSLDSVTRLVDGLAAQLLALGAGEPNERLAALTSTSLPALRAYLNGQSLLRRGLFDSALNQFELALRRDSTFALAGLGRDEAAAWSFPAGLEPSRGSQIAWRHRERLSLRDRAELSVMLGPRFPGRSNRRDFLEAAERFVREAPDAPGAWYALGDYLYHYGALIGIGDAHTRARVAFERATTLDSTFAPALEHGPQLAFELGGTAELHRAVRQLLAVDSTSPRAAAARWYVAAALGDSAGLRAELQDDSLPRMAGGLIALSYDQGIGVSQLGQVVERARRAAVTAEERWLSDLETYLYLHHVGRPLQARLLLASAPTPERHLNAVSVGLFGDGDSAAMTESAVALARELGSQLVATDEVAVNNRYLAGQYALARGRPAEVRRAIADLRATRIPADSVWAASPTSAYALILEAQLAARESSSDAGRLLAELDSTLLTGPEGPCVPGNLVAARLHEQRGELTAALAAVRRRIFGLNPWPEYVTYLREEGRLAALTGDRVGAVRAYRHYLAVRIDPEPGLRAQVAQVRADLAALEHGMEDSPVTQGP